MNEQRKITRHVRKTNKKNEKKKKLPLEEIELIRENFTKEEP